MNNIDEIRKAKPNDEFEVTCAHCGKTFKKTKAYIRKISYRLPKFCSKECSKAWKKEKCRNSEVEHAQDLGVSRYFPEGQK